MTTLKGDIETAIRSKTNLSEEDAFATVDKRWLSKKFTFQGQDIDLVWSCGLFITMNPGKSFSNIARGRSFTIVSLRIQVMLVVLNYRTT